MPNTETQADGLSDYLANLAGKPATGTAAPAPSSDGLADYLANLANQPPAPAEVKPATVSDYAREFGASAVDSVGSIGQFIGEGAAAIANKVTGTENYESKNVLKPVSDSIRSGMTEGGKKAGKDANVEGSVVDLFSGKAKLPDSADGWLMMGANGFGSMVSTLLPMVGWAGKTSSIARAADVASKTAKAAEVAGDTVKAAEYATRAAELASAVKSSSTTGKVIGAGLEGATTGGAAAGDVRGTAEKIVTGMTHEQLMEQMPIYAETFYKTGDAAQARNAVVNGAARWAAGLSAAAGAAGGAFNAKVIEDFLVHKGISSVIGNTTASRLGRGAISGAGASLAEGGQELTEKVGQNAGENIGLNRDMGDNVLRDTAGDFLGGVVVGGPTGFGGGLTTHHNPATPAPAVDPVAAAAATPNSPLSRAVTVGKPVDLITSRVNEVKTAVRDGGLLDKLGQIGQGATTRTEFLEALAIAENPNQPPKYREAALADVNRAMGWIADGKMPGAEANGSPFSTDLTTQPAPAQPGTDLATAPSADLTNPGMPKAFDPNVVDVDATRVDNMIGGPKALPGPQRGLTTQEHTAQDSQPKPVEAKAEPAPAATEKVAPEAGAPTQNPTLPAPASTAPKRTMVKAPKAPFVKDDARPGTAQMRQRKDQLQAMAEDGFDTVERQADGSFHLINPVRNEALALNGMGDAQLARKAIADHIDGAANKAETKPTDGQIQAENYKKGHLRLNGMDISIENPRHGTRSGISPDGKKWSSKMAHHYGYFKRTEGADGDAMDVFIGPRPDSSKVFIVDQNKPDGTFDEHKVMMGFNDIESARAGYLANYEKGWTGLGAITEMPLSTFKKWVKSDAAKLPAAGYDQTHARDNTSAPGESQQNTGDATNTGTQTTASQPADGSGHVDGKLRNSETQDAGRNESPARDSGADAAAVAALAKIEGNPSIKLADPAHPDTKALDALLDIFAKLTGQRGIAIESDSWNNDGAEFQGRFFINVKNPVQHVAMTIGHEFKHLTETHPGLAKMYDRLWSMISEDGKKKYYEEYLAKGRKYAEATPSQLEHLKNEMIADFIGKRFRDRAWLSDLATQKPKLFGDFVRDWIKVLGQLIGSLQALAGRGNGINQKNVDQYISDLKQAKEIAMDVATVWAEHNPKLATDGAVQHSDKSGDIDVDYDLDMVSFLDAQAKQDAARDLAASESAAKAAKANPYKSVTESSIKSKGLQAEDAYPELKWKDALKDGTRFDATIPMEGSGLDSVIMLEQRDDGTWGATMKGTWIGPADMGNDGYVSLDAAKKFAQRYAASFDLAKRGFDLSDTVTPEKKDGLVNAWNELNRLDLPERGIRRYGRVEEGSKVARAIANDMGITDTYDLTIDAQTIEPGHRKLEITFTDKINEQKQGAYLEFTKDGDHYLGIAHTENLKRGGVGAAFYQMMAEYSAMHNIRIEPDFALSGVNSYRRTEQMLSAALRTGKSNVMIPHEVQRIYGFNDDANTEAEHRDNIARMLLAGLRNVREIVPEVDELNYHPETGLFTNKSGEDADSQVALILGEDDVRAFGVGRSTLARAVMTRMLMDGDLKADQIDGFASPVLYSARDEAEIQYDAVDAQYRSTDKWMKAPNGEPTKLNERQWIQVRTPLFKKWFGDWESYAGKQGGVWNDSDRAVSKVVDENGEPLVVYHGTDKGGFYEFNGTSGKGRGDLGIFASDNKDMARTYVRRGTVRDITPPDSRRDFEDHGYEFDTSDDGKIVVSTPDGDILGPFESEQEAVRGAAETYRHGYAEPVVYATFMNLRDPYETDFQGASWDGSRQNNGQFEVYDADGDVARNDKGEEFMSQEEAQELADKIGGTFEPGSDHYESTDSAVKEGRKSGDGTIIRNVIDDGGGAGRYIDEASGVFVATDPNQVKSAEWNTGEFGSTEDLRFSARPVDFANPEDRLTVSTAQPWAKTDKKTGYQPNSYTEKRVIDSQDILASETHVKTIVDALRKYNTLTGKGNPKAVLKELHETVVASLLWLHDHVSPEARHRAKLWYDGANKIATEWTHKFGLNLRQTGGILAVFSPQMDWFKNVSLAERAITIMHDHAGEQWTDGMTKWSESWLNASTTVATKASRQAIVEKMRAIAESGKTLSELSPQDASYFIRAFDEAYFSRSYRLVTPEGGFGDYVTKGTALESESESEEGVVADDASVTWGGYGTIEKAVEIYRNGSHQTVDTELGGEHKVRNFYNNIVDPNSPDGHVTIDTHAIAAAFMKALSGASDEVKHNLGGLGSTAATGASGSYALFADAYRDAAEQRGILAREMQSITWEAVRSMFPASLKKGMSEKVNAVWNEVKAGKLTHEEARNEVWWISREAGGDKPFAWHNSGAGDFVADGAQSFDTAIATDPAAREVRTMEPKSAKDKLQISLSAATDKIAGIDALYTLAKGGDTAAHTLLQDVARIGLSDLLSGTSAKLSVEPSTGLYGGASEPSLAVTVTFNDEDRQTVLAVLAKFADNFNQEQLHVRQGTSEKPGTKFDDSSFATPVYRWELKKSLSTKRIQEVIDKSGLYGLTFGDTFVEAYFVGDPHDAQSIDKFQNDAGGVGRLLGSVSSEAKQSTARIWVYGEGDGAIGYEHIRGDIPAGTKAYSETARRVAAYLAGVEKVKTFNNKPVTPKQDALQTEIGQTYEVLPDNDLAASHVKKAYTEAAKEFLRQYKALPIKVEIMVKKDANGVVERVNGELVPVYAEPYSSPDGNNSKAMRRDILDNNHLYVYGTTANTFGPEGSDFSGHPLLEDSGLKDVNGYPLLYNDLLRAVHDYFAHAMSPTSFGPVGEEAAWKNHMSMTRNMWARWALTSETRGQNSWVNFRKDLDRNTPIKDREFARQKVALLPIVYALTGDPVIDKPMKAFIEALPEKKRIGSKPGYSSREGFDYEETNHAVQGDGSAEAAGGSIDSTQSGVERGAAQPVARDADKRGAGKSPDRAARVEGAIHYGRRPGLSYLSGASFGSGIRGAEQSRLSESTDPRIKKRVYFYLPTARGIPQAEIGLGSNVYRANIEGLYDTASRTVRGSGNAFESAVLDAGYKGYINREQGTLVVLGDSVPVDHIGNSTDFEITQRVIERAKHTIETRTEGNRLVRKMTDPEVIDYYRNKDKIEAAAPSFMTGYGEARVLADEAPAADKVLREIGSTLQFGKPMYSVRPPQELFVSELGKQIDKASMKQAPAGAWKDFIKALTQKGVKQDEIEWSGVNDWLDLQEGKVTREALAEYLKSGGVKVTETTMDGKIISENLSKRQLASLAYHEAVEKSMEAGEPVNPSWIEDQPESERTPLMRELLSAWTAVSENPEEDPTVDRNPDPKYAQYTLPGGDNYREVLLTLPPKKLDIEGADRLAELRQKLLDMSSRAAEMRRAGQDMTEHRAKHKEIQQEIESLENSVEVGTLRALNANPSALDNYQSSHWKTPNVLAHIRLNDRMDSDGNRVLFVEELQSDWGQEGKKKGFDGDPDGWIVLFDGDEVQTFDTKKDAEKKAKSIDGAYVAPMVMSGADAKTPRAPFVTKTDAWLSLALKRVIGLAVDGGYDKVAFVNGRQSADRYKLSHQVDKVSVGRVPESMGKWQVIARRNNEVVVDRVVADDNGLAALIGKDLAEKFVASNGGSRSGLDLDVGGSGMVSFYDKLVPIATKDVLRKLGGGQMESVDIYNAKKIGPASSKTMQQPGFTITSALREKVDAGLPLFSKRQEPAEPAKKPGKYAGKKVVVPVRIEDTGEVAELTMDVESTLDDFDVRQANMRKLLGCLG